MASEPHLDQPLQAGGRDGFGAARPHRERDLGELPQHRVPLFFQLGGSAHDLHQTITTPERRGS